mgnify:CR=1 FL=1
MPLETSYSETEERIFDAALTVFARKGKDGARMQEIADEAAINKAMLHYYFRSKDQLYEAVFDYVFRRFMGSFAAALRETQRFDETLRTFIDSYIDFVAGHQRVVRLMVTEQLAGGAVMQQRLGSLFQSGEAPPRLFAQRVEAAIGVALQHASGDKLAQAAAIRAADPDFEEAHDVGGRAKAQALLVARTVGVEGDVGRVDRRRVRAIALARGTEDHACGAMTGAPERGRGEHVRDATKAQSDR